MSGFYRLRRGWMDSPLCPKPFCRGLAFVWLVENARWSDGPVDVLGTTIQLRRGQLSYSNRFLAKAWGWEETKVRRFLKRLVKDSEIASQGDGAQSIITVCNYDSLQAHEGETASPTASLAPHHHLSTASNKKKEKEGKKERESPLETPSADPVERELFASVIKLQDPCVEAVALWNELAVRLNFPQLRSLSADRRATLRARLREAAKHMGLEEMSAWREVLRLVSQSPYMRGEINPGYRASFDSITGRKVFTRLLEGTYAENRNRCRPYAIAEALLAEPDDEWGGPNHNLREA